MTAPIPGISDRMLGTIRTMGPIAAGVGSGVVNAGDINLADGENTLMKEAMVEICREAINKNLTDEVCFSVFHQSPLPLLAGLQGSGLWRDIRYVDGS